MAQDLLVAGGGIAGLAAALAASRAGWSPLVCEQAAVFAEIGAGLQLGPNATRRLREWGVLDDPALGAWEPPRLSVRDAVDGRELGVLPLAGRARDRYGSPYFTVHRADLHGALLRAVQAAGVPLQAATRVVGVEPEASRVRARMEAGGSVEVPALAIADGVWSRLREPVVGDGPAPATGHVACRALVPRAHWPEVLRGDDVQAWLGPRMHLIRYPVRAGDAINVVAFVEGRAAMGWDHAAGEGLLRHAARGLSGELQAIVEAIGAWRLWPVHDRNPVRSAREMARGRVALLGDAAHPMRPYLAQGAGMAIEDAAELAACLAECATGEAVPAALQRYAERRWARCARVQARSRRNGWIFHADGPLRLARNAAMRLGGEGLLDLPWLYAG